MDKVFILLLLIFGFKAVAQNDSVDVQVDTVIVREDPVIINKTFVMPPDSNFLNKHWWFVGAGFSVAQNNFLWNDKESEIRTKNWTSYNIHFGREFNRISLESGLSILNSVAKISLSDKIAADKIEVIRIKDTIDSYNHTVNGVTTVYYLTEDRDTTISRSVIKDSSYSIKEPLRVIQIPILIRYQLIKRKWGLHAGIGLNTNMKISSNPGLERKAGGTPGKLAFSYRAEIALSRELFYNFNVYSFIQYNNIISFKNQRSSYVNFNLLSVGLRINYFF